VSNILESVAKHAPALILAEGVVAAVLLFFVLVLGARVRRFEAFRRRAELGGSEAEAGSMLTHLSQRTAELTERMGRAEIELRNALNVLEGCVQHVGAVRYDAFEDVGGQQSFSIALLDARRNGILITAIYSRTDVRLYAKSLNHGRPSSPMTPEESAAVQHALGLAPGPGRSGSSTEPRDIGGTSTGGSLD